MGEIKEWGNVGVVCALVALAWTGAAYAQDDLEADLGEDASLEGELGAESEDDALGESEPEAEPKPEPEAEPEPEAPAPEEVAAGVELDASTAAGVSLEPADELVDEDAAGDAEDDDEEEPALWVSSHIRRPSLMATEDGRALRGGPLRVFVQDRNWLQYNRQLSGAAPPDTFAALGYGGAGTSHVTLRVQPTLVLLNGRRLVAAPQFGSFNNGNAGHDFVDINQLPIQLIERVETTYGNTGALYGDGAIGGTANYVTRRNFDGLEVDLGGQSTDDFNQREADVALTVGTGDDDRGIVAFVSYFNRSPLAASDSDWIGGREDRTEALLGNPATYQQLTNFDYPISDPFCNIAQQAGHSNGYEVRLRGYGPPETLNLLSEEQQQFFISNHDVPRGGQLGTTNGVIDELETTTYCAVDYTGNQDLILKEERIQAYSTFWQALGDHAELFGELGYYRTENENRTAPAFPIVRLSADPSRVNPVWVPPSHADQPVEEFGFAAVEASQGRIPNSLWIVGRTQGNHNGSGLNSRVNNTLRGVIGVKGDLEGLSGDSVLQSWDWEVAGMYSQADSLSRVQDTLMDRLADALNSCPATKMVDGEEVPTTIKERQDAGCYNPFYSSVTNNAAVNPLGVSINGSVPSSSNGFITTDTDTRFDDGFGQQDGGYICDPAVDPDACPDAFDPNGDGEFELAGTPNTQQVIDRITGQQITYQRRTLATVDGVVRGDVAEFSGGGLSFSAGGQYRREGIAIDYDSEYNQRQFAFLFGADDLNAIDRDIFAGFGELRLSVLDGLVEVQGGARAEHYEDVGLGTSLLGGLAVRPFAGSDSPPEALEWLFLRGHVGTGHRAPSLLQMYGTQNDFVDIDYRGTTIFVPQQISGNPDLDFEKYTSFGAGIQWEFKGLHIGVDGWASHIDDMVGADNADTLLHDCTEQYEQGFSECEELSILGGTTAIDHLETSFDNLAEVDTNGVDALVMYVLDTKRRGLGDVGTFVVGAWGSYINSYLINSPRGLREFYRDGTEPEQGGASPTPAYADGNVRDYSQLNAEYEAAGWRNVENFAPPMPQLRLFAPVRWLYEGHVLGFNVRHVGGYNDDSEHTVERYGFFGIDQLQFATGEEIPSWTVFDAVYGFTFGEDNYQTRLQLGVLNVLDEAPPAVEGPLGYEAGVHDPRGRTIYARVTSKF